MLTIQDLEAKVQGLRKQLDDSQVAYTKADQALKQQLANHNALEGAVMMAQQMLMEEQAKEKEKADKEAKEQEEAAKKDVPEA
jgi:hypothetical protein